MKEQFRDSSVIKKVSHVTFSLMSSDEMRHLSHVCVDTKQMYSAEGSRKPTSGGVLDAALGASRKNEICPTCGQGFADCMGHFGYIDLELPVFHCGYLGHVVKILQTICKTCSRVLLRPDKREKYLTLLVKPAISYLQKKTLRKKIHADCKSVRVCFFCNAINGVIKKGGLVYILHDRLRGAKAPVLDQHVSEFQVASAANPEVAMLARRGIEVLRPLRVRQLLDQIPLEELPFLMMHATHAHPRDLLLFRVPVPPSAIRPSVTNEVRSGTTEDDITAKLADVAFINQIIRHHLTSNSQVHKIQDDWEMLSYLVTMMINSDCSGVPNNIFQGRKFVRGYVQRLKGKQGRFRGHLSGKRSNFTGRTVISPDPNMRIDQVCVPIYTARKLTYPERVTLWNLSKLQKLVRAGAERHPGALYIEARDGRHPKRMLEFSNQSRRDQAALDLRPGDLVERHLLDGDIVLFNRQPSLHKLSIQAFEAVVKPYRTFRFNECCCGPFNADFDGDEMNLHVPQTEEARAEAKILMGSTNNITTPRNGEPLVAAIQDFITGAYLLTQKDVFFTRDKVCQMLTHISSGRDIGLRIELPRPCIVKPYPLWSGKQVFSVILRPNKKCPVRVNLRARTKALYEGGEDMCPNDGFVVVHHSELLLGSVEKKTIGSGSKENIFYVLLRDWGSQVCADVMWRLTRLIPSYLTHRGFSIGIGDVTPSARLVAAKRQLVHDGFVACEELIVSLKKGTLTAQPGCSIVQTCENQLSKELSDVREAAGKACKRELHYSNAPLVMAKCGSKGSFLNISQMIACVGQQVISGKRTPDGFEGRSLPHFPRHSLAPEAKGFVGNSFYSGLTPTEFFFHTMSGREGLVDTAVKTADTGYMQRRLMKALEDLCVHYDGTVRTSQYEVVQFVYGGDSLDPQEMEGSGQVMGGLLDLKRELVNACAVEPVNSHEAASQQGEDGILEAVHLRLLAAEILKVDDFQRCSKSFHKDLSDFLEERASNMEASRARLPHHLPVRMQLERLTARQLKRFMMTCLEKFYRAQVEPGAPVGALCAQSIGEPATQMTLKTFHFAGVASMNITQGVPRIKELINAAQNISTPIISCRLERPDSESEARRVKARIEQTRLGQVSLFIEEVLESDECYVLVQLDRQRLDLLKLELSLQQIGEAIMSSKLKRKPVRIEKRGDDQLLLWPSAPCYVSALRNDLVEVPIQGLSSVRRSVLHRDEKKGLLLYVEGNQLREVMATRGVDGRATTSNSIIEVANVLGVEAARTTIMLEMQEVMVGHGVEVDVRHVGLLADLMTHKGEVLGNQRHGIAKLKESVLMLASFEMTADHLFEAAYHGQTDDLSGVSESIIMGMPMRLGTGLFQLLYNPPIIYRQCNAPSLRPLVFDSMLSST